MKAFAGHLKSRRAWLSSLIAFYFCMGPGIEASLAGQHTTNQNTLLFNQEQEKSDTDTDTDTSSDSSDTNPIEDLTAKEILDKLNEIDSDSKEYRNIIDAMSQSSDPEVKKLWEDIMNAIEGGNPIPNNKTPFTLANPPSSDSPRPPGKPDSTRSSGATGALGSSSTPPNKYIPGKSSNTNPELSPPSSKENSPLPDSSFSNLTEAETPVGTSGPPKTTRHTPSETSQFSQTHTSGNSSSLNNDNKTSGTVPLNSPPAPKSITGGTVISSLASPSSDLSRQSEPGLVSRRVSYQSEQTPPPPKTQLDTPDETRAVSPTPSLIETSTKKSASSSPMLSIENWPQSNEQSTSPPSLNSTPQSPASAPSSEKTESPNFASQTQTSVPQTSFEQPLETSSPQPSTSRSIPEPFSLDPFNALKRELSSSNPKETYADWQSTDEIAPDRRPASTGAALNDLKPLSRGLIESTLENTPVSDASEMYQEMMEAGVGASKGLLRKPITLKKTIPLKSKIQKSASNGAPPGKSGLFKGIQVIASFFKERFKTKQ